MKLATTIPPVLMRKAISKLTALLSRMPRPLSMRLLGSSLFLFAGVRDPATSTYAESITIDLIK